MNSKPVVALECVSDDVQVAYDYFALRFSGGGERFLERYFRTIDQIALNPWSFPVKFDDYHRALIPKTSLAIYYFERDENTVVVCVIDARRHPRLIRDLVRGRRDR